MGLFFIGEAKREFDARLFLFESGVHLLPRQSRHSWHVAVLAFPPDIAIRVSATFVKIVSRRIVCTAVVGFGIRAARRRNNRLRD